MKRLMSNIYVILTENAFKMLAGGLLSVALFKGCTSISASSKHYGVVE